MQSCRLHGFIIPESRTLRWCVLRCTEGKFPMVELIGLVINLLSIAALVAGTVLSWSAATTIDTSYQVHIQK